MTTLTATQARANFFTLLDWVADTHKPIRITGRGQNGVLVSEEDFRIMRETLNVPNVPGMKESLLKAKKSPLKTHTQKRPW